MKNDDFEASRQFQARRSEQTEPTKPHRFAEPVFKSTANCGHFHSAQVPDGRATESLK